MVPQTNHLQQACPTAGAAALPPSRSPRLRPAALLLRAATGSAPTLRAPLFVDRTGADDRRSLPERYDWGDAFGLAGIWL